MTRRGEFELIAALFAPLAKAAPGALNLTDDAALLDVSAGHSLVLTADALISGVHFLADDPPELVARKALRVNLSDLAAKGARPRGFMMTLALSDAQDDRYLEQFAAGLQNDVTNFGVPLLGGDTTAGPGPFTVSITALGEVEQGCAILRRGARPGDTLYVSGTIGDGALGLACLQKRLSLNGPHCAFLENRYHLPQPRVRVGQGLAGLASAGLDISDGLVADAGHMADVSAVGIEIDAAKIPLSSAAQAALKNDPALMQSVLGGGDDYELIFAAPDDRAAAIAQLAQDTGVPLTAIGRVVDGNGVTVRDANGRDIPVPSPGFRHR